MGSPTMPNDPAPTGRGPGDRICTAHGVLWCGLCFPTPREPVAVVQQALEDCMGGEPPGAGWRPEAAAIVNALRRAGLLRQTTSPGARMKPRVGMRVRYVRGEAWGPRAGDVGTVIDVREPGPKDGFAREPVFWVRLDNYPTSQFYTTPRDVEALPDAE
jgi:hypothetical protein